LFYIAPAGENHSQRAQANARTYSNSFSGATVRR
jgi:hypothetical protein